MENSDIPHDALLADAACTATLVVRRERNARLTIMKIKLLLIAFTALASVPVQAESVPPRVKENQTRMVRGVTEDRLHGREHFVRRADIVRHPRISGQTMDPNLVRRLQCRTMSPRAVEAAGFRCCPEMAL
jgi:hypothetical protein